MKENLKKILYIEDDSAIAEIALMTLEDIGGFEVLHCDSGKKALEVFTEFQPQLVLSDVMMPTMDGLETAYKLRKLKGAEDIPIIFMTARMQTHELQEYQLINALGVIAKPFNPLTLCNEITTLWETM